MTRAPAVTSVLWLNPLKYGSMEEYAVHLSRALTQRGWRSILVFSGPLAATVSPHFEGSGAVIEVFEDAGTFKRYRSLVRILRTYRPDIVHFHFFNVFTVLPILASLSRPRAVFFTDHVREGEGISWKTKVQCLLWDRVVLRLLGTRVLAVSDHIKRTLVNKFKMAPGRVQVLYNGVNLRRFQALDPDQATSLRNELHLQSGQAVVICASNLRPEKGISDLLAAAKEVLANKPDCIFLIVGDGSMADKLETEAEELGIERSVRFTGLRSDVDRLMGLADLVAVPSTCGEAAPFVVLEAMASARPTVATRVGGIPEFVEDGVTGILVSPQCPGELAHACLRLVDLPNEAAAMGRAGEGRVKAHFSIDRWVRDTVELYDNALRVRSLVP